MECKGDITKIIESQTFSDYNNINDESINSNNLKNEIISRFALNSKNYNTIENSIKTVYGKEIDIDLSKAYITKLFCMSDEGYEIFLMDLEDYKVDLEDNYKK